MIDWSSWVPRERATLMFIIQNEEILLIRKKRGLGAGKINGPGGRIEPGETPEQAVVRETQEELLITPLDPSLRGELRFQFLDGYSLHCGVFTATTFSGSPTETDEATPIWAPIHAIPFHEMWADDQHWLPGVIQGGFFLGDFVFDGEIMQNHHVSWYDRESFHNLKRLSASVL